MRKATHASADQHESYTTTLLSWETPTFIPLPRGALWHGVAGFAMIFFITYAVLNRSLTMMLAFMMLGIVFWLHRDQKPRITQVSITEMGIEYDGKMYPYHTINSFWIIYHPPYIRSFYLKVGGKRHRIVKIELNDQNPVVLRNLLIKEIPEIEGAGEPFFDALSRLLRLQ